MLDFSSKIYFFFSNSCFISFISFYKITFLEAKDLTLPCKISFSVFKASDCTFKFSNYFLLFYACIAEVLVDEKLLLVLLFIFVAWVNPLIWETFIPFVCSFSYNSFTFPFNLSIFCCLPLQALSPFNTWSILKFYPISLSITLIALFN